MKMTLQWTLDSADMGGTTIFVRLRAMSAKLRARS